ncbi:MAG: ATP-dependent DNA helicase RecG [Limisphaerales bacterium]
MPTPSAKPSLDLPVTVVRGVGPERAFQLARLGVQTVGQLLLHRPRRYEDRRRLGTIAELQLKQPAAARGRIVAQGVKRFRRGSQSVFEFILEDGTGRLHCRWWNLPFLADQFAVGDEVFVFGKPVSLKPRTMDHPETEIIEGGDESSIHLNRVVPIYPLTEGLPQRWLRGLLWRALAEWESKIEEPWPALALTDFPQRAAAIRGIHFPAESIEADRARERLALDEFIELQLAIQRRRRRLQANARGLPCRGDNRLMKPFLAGLGFTLTAAQTRVLREIRAGLGGPFPMRRLLQGDVGSGKTVVAACAALMALESGFDVAIMAPTEILAEQHGRTFRDWFGPLGIAVHLLTGNRTSAGPETTKPATGALFVGTHALLHDRFAPDRLGLVIIDEQHRFGVTQREQLVRKGCYPHLLVMTATPIPRTLGLTLYGDLDVSVIDELPAGRSPMKTYVRSVDALPKVWKFVREQLAEGRQAYIVYPRVEEGDLQTGMKAVKAEHTCLRAELAPFEVGLLHGRLASDDKDAVMEAFRANRIQTLIATSVIEVGVDVPNATVMVIENAESFGLAQLHQLRGRIGRGEHPSHCILVAAAKTEEARERLQVLADTTDGFQIAEADLQLRGPGELLGQQQSGLPRLRFGNLARDLVLIDRARGLASQLLDLHDLRNPPLPGRRLGRPPSLT